MRTRAYVVLLLPALLSSAPPEPPGAAARQWIAAARAHRPGTIDEPLLEVSGWQPGQFAVVRQDLGKALAELPPSPLERALVLSRGVLLHTDIAILTPNRAANFTYLPPGRLSGSLDPRPRSEPPQATSVIIGSDGQFLNSMTITAHWSFARALTRSITADPSRDSFVRDWYHATTGRFMATYAFGTADPHLEDARKVLPHDAWVLFYSGALHEAYASTRAQNILRSGPTWPAQARTVRDPSTELQNAAEYYEEALETDPAFAEAHLRYGRVLALLGRHLQATDELRQAQTLAHAPALEYFAALFLAHELDALGQREAARIAFERAAALFPTAQSPWIGLSALARRAGNRQHALDALQRVAALPPIVRQRDDPWWTYFRSYADDPDALLNALRARFRSEPGP